MLSYDVKLSLKACTGQWWSPQIAHHHNFSVIVQEVQLQMEIKFGGDQSNEMGGVGEVVVQAW